MDWSKPKGLSHTGSHVQSMSLETEIVGEQEPEERMMLHEELNDQDETRNEKPSDAFDIAGALSRL